MESSKLRITDQETKESQTESVRTTRPGSYMFKIQTFSLTKDFFKKACDVKCFESPEFQVSSHKWKLCVYPNGDKKQGVEDHISLYLVAVDADSSTNSGYSELNVTFKMFVYDHLRDNFLTIQDDEVKRFHRLKKEWGFPHLISHERFEDDKNGYLVNDSCVFGVEIYVIPSTVNVGCFKMIKEPIEGTFTWKVNKFSKLGDSEYSSEIFQGQGHKWKLKLYPNGNSSGKGTHLSIFLQFVDVENDLELQKKHIIYIHANIKLKDQVNGNDLEMQLMYWWDKAGLSIGYQKFVSLNNLRDDARGFLLKDCLILEVKFEVMSKMDSN